MAGRLTIRPKADFPASHPWIMLLVVTTVQFY